MFHEKEDYYKDFTGRDFYVIVADNSTHVLNFLKNTRGIASNGKFVLMFPGPVSGGQFGLKSLFFNGWIAGKKDIVVLMSDDALCSVYSYIPVKDRGNYYNNTVPVLFHNWTRETRTRNHTGVKYFSERKPSNLNQSSIDVYIELENFYWDPFVDFLQVAMNATFNINHTARFKGGDPGVDSILPRIFVSGFYARRGPLSYFVFPPFYGLTDMVYAVPRRLTSSVEWFRLVNELSGYTWLCLFVALVLSLGVIYLFTTGSRDFASIVLFTVQPLLQQSWHSRFLSQRGQIVGSFWLLFCFVLNSSYLCTLLSQLTVPSTSDAIKSFDDLVKSNVPVHATIHDHVLSMYERESTNLCQIKHKLTNSEKKGNPSTLVKRDRHDIAYIVDRQDGEEWFANMSYRFLPEVMYTFSTIPIRMTRPSPYEDIFSRAMMRCMAAGAMDKVFRERRHSLLLLSRSSTIGDEKVPKPLLLSSFGTLFVVWSLGCTAAFFVFLAEVHSLRKLRR